MKKRIICLLAAILLILAAGCGQASPSAAPAPKDTVRPAAAPAAEQPGMKRYYIPELEGTISVPEEYYVFGKDIDYTDEMCREAGVDPSKMATYFSVNFDQAQIIPAGESFVDPSIRINVKIKPDKYKGVDFGSMSEKEYKAYADKFIKEFSTAYTTLEQNGMRFIVFDWKGPSTDSYRYATIIEGDMIYVYAVVSGDTITAEQRDLLKNIAVSIDRS